MEKNVGGREGGALEEAAGVMDFAEISASVLWS
jgi:hypothetical protein